MRISPADRRQFIDKVSAEFTHEYRRSFARRLLSLGTTSCRLAENECNLEMNEDEQRKHDAKVETTDRNIRVTASQLGTTAVLQGDPRGHTAKILLPNGYALPVPTS